MSRCRLRILSRVVILACVLASHALAWQAKRLYVEPFAVKAGSEKLREDLITQLRRRTSISLVSDQAMADVTLSGGGEIWIKGYRSLNPRSGRQPSNGTPVYAGFLSVELKNSRGETIWSDLVTPGAASEDISKDLSLRIAKHVAEALEHGDGGQPRVPAQSATSLTGAGATFPQPIYSEWFTNYSRENPAVKFIYDPIGSEAGIRRLLDGGVDFGASDNPDIVREIAPNLEAKYLFFPSVIGAVVPIVNLPGFAGEIAFTPEALAGIYLGKIKKWNDPILRQSNRGLRLPDLDIVVVHRADGSGTSYAFAQYLGLTPNWPIGRAANGNDGVARLVKELGGSIGYVEFIYALQNHLSFGKVQNKHGEFVAAGLESIAAAVESSMPGSDFEVSLVDAPGPGAYPIVSFTWFVVPAHMADDSKRIALAEFLKWMLGPGQRQAAALGYLPLPEAIVRSEQTAIGGIR
jgi:phosphate transport system substrate-binding protein